MGNSSASTKKFLNWWIALLSLHETIADMEVSSANNHMENYATNGVALMHFETLFKCVKNATQESSAKIGEDEKIHLNFLIKDI